MLTVDQIFANIVGRKQPENEKKGKPKKILPFEDLGCSRLRASVMAFVYLPAGEKIYLGSIDVISKHLASFPTCHASICEKRSEGYKFSVFHILGKYSDANVDKNKFYFKIITGSKRQPLNDFYFGMNVPKWEKVLTARKKYYLVRDDLQDIEIINSWRSLPKRHLRDLAYIDNPELKKEPDKNRWTNLEL